MTTPEARRERELTIIRQQKTILAALAAVLVLVLLANAIQFFVINPRQVEAADQNRQNVDLIHDSQVGACEASLQPKGIRYVVAQSIKTDLAQSKTIDYSQFFPNVPVDQLHALIVHSQKVQRQQIHDLLDVDCNALYPTPRR